MKKTRILLISVAAGSGHVQAARALEETASTQFNNIDVRHIDLADFARFPTKKAFFDSYGMLVRTLPELWGYLYKKTNAPHQKKRLMKTTKLIQSLQSKKFLKTIRDWKPDHIVYTHFAPAMVLRNCKDEALKSIPQHMVITDYGIHELWIANREINYYVATPKMKWKLEQKSIPSKCIHITGIPIAPVFTEEKSAQALKKKYALPPHQKTLLLLGGGHGLVKLHKIVERLLEEEEEMTVLAVAGNNKTLLKKLNALKAPSRINYQPLGWTDAIDEYMRMADMIITKPGGMTTSECLALGKPMIMIDPIPGQEEHNAQFSVLHGLGIIAQGLDDIVYAVRHGVSCAAPSIHPPAAESILGTIIN